MIRKILRALFKPYRHGAAFTVWLNGIKVMHPVHVIIVDREMPHEDEYEQAIKSYYTGLGFKANNVEVKILEYHKTI